MAVKHGTRQLDHRVREEGVRTLDIRFCDVAGNWRHVAVPAETALEGDILTRGVGFDGSSVSGFSSVERSDLRVVPDQTTAVVDPFWEQPTLAVIGDVVEAESGRPHPLDPRGVARRAEEYLRSSGIADLAIFSLEPEFYIFRSVAFSEDAFSSEYRVEPETQQGAGYHVMPPMDRHHNLRQEIVDTLEEAGFSVKYHHHESGRYGQGEVEVRFEPLVRSGDLVMLLKYSVRNVADRWGRTATFMPRPLAYEPGNGMHVHQKLFWDGRPLFYDPDGYSGLSQEALSYLGGILTHARALSALTCPSTNSYRRLSGGHEAPVALVFSTGNRTAAVRIPSYARAPEAKSLEYRVPDPSANPYLVLAGLVMAGVWGIKNGIDPQAAGFGPLDRNIYQLAPHEKANLQYLPDSLEEALDCLESDHRFLLEGEVFTPRLIETILEEGWRQIREIRARPHPYEFVALYDR